MHVCLLMRLFVCLYICLFVCLCVCVCVCVCTGVDPVAADRIVEYLRTVRLAQGILFASHRIDECLSICQRVCMLFDGELRFDGPINIFDGVAAEYYQVDVTTTPDNGTTSIAYKYSGKQPDAEGMLRRRAEEGGVGVGVGGEKRRGSGLNLLQNLIISRIAADCGSADKIARFMEYSSTLVRITFLKDEVPFTFAWKLLNQYRRFGLISKYSFRAMGTEEVLSTMISGSNGEERKL